MTKTVLIVDDELGYREMLQMELSDEGFTVLTAGNGLDALEILEREKVDIVVTDMKMPKMDGLDTVKAIKSFHPDVPIILMTGYALGDRVREALILKATTCLKKPFTVNDLTYVIQTVLP